MPRPNPFAPNGPYLDSTLQKWRISCPMFTIQANTKSRSGPRPAPRIIVETAPIARKFIGQPLGDLLVWARIKTGVEPHLEELK